MDGREFSELNAFVAVARHRSFSKAAAEIGLSLPTISQTIRSLESKLGIRLLNRTTRSVAPTEAGEQLLLQLQPALESVDEALLALDAFRGTPRGMLRLNVGRMAAMKLIAPLLARFMDEYPEVNVEVVVDDALTDIVSERFDAGVRFGKLLEQDMVAIRLGDDIHPVVVASPAYLAGRRIPKAPKDLLDHVGIRTRLPWDGAILKWHFERDGEQQEISVNGPLTVNDFCLALQAALDGVGVAYLPGEMVDPRIREGRLVRMLEDWSPAVPGYYLYYSSRRQIPPPLRAFVDFVQKTPRLRSALAYGPTRPPFRDVGDTTGVTSVLR
jgi:DNA-binding transcriptional LysR family regulator